MRDPGQRQRPLLGAKPVRKDWPGYDSWKHWRRRRRDGRRPGYSGARHRANGLFNQRRILPRMRTPGQPQHSMLGAQRTRADRDRYEQRRRHHCGDGVGPGDGGPTNDQVILCLLRMVLLMRDNPGRHGQVLGRKLRREAGGLRWCGRRHRGRERGDGWRTSDHQPVHGPPGLRRGRVDRPLGL